METFLENDMNMAKVNEAKVVDTDAAISNALEASSNQAISNKDFVKIKETLQKVSELEDWEITPEIVQEVDGTIKEVANVTVGEDGEAVVVIDGTENFGYTLRPKDWKASRIAGMESLLEELARNIKRWANQITGSLKETWEGWSVSTKTLESRAEEALSKMGMLYEKPLPGKDKVKLSSYLIQSFILNERLPSEKIVPFLTKESSNILMALKTWEFESLNYKNALIKYFGNPGKGLNLVRPKSKLFNIPVTQLNTPETQVFKLRNNLIGDYNIYYTVASNNDNTIETLAECGYGLLIPNKKYDKDTTMNCLTNTELGSVYNVVLGLIEVIKKVSSVDNVVNLTESDIKDVLSTNKNNGDVEFLNSYGLLSSSYQINVDRFKHDVVKWLTLLTSHLLTLMFINMECYDES